MRFSTFLVDEPVTLSVYGFAGTILLGRNVYVVLHSTRRTALHLSAVPQMPTLFDVAGPLQPQIEYFV